MRTKRDCKFGWALLAFGLWAFPSSSFAATAEELGDCNWVVTYRGRTYDLAPITREALARPIETDLRYALQRVPEANAHLKTMASLQKDARAHTILASLFLSGFLVTRLLKSRDTDTGRAREYNIISGATGAFFFGAAFSSWRATSEAKQELVKAVDAFNEKSPHKIEPASAKKQEFDFGN
jgi:hypothetical protein